MAVFYFDKETIHERGSLGRYGGWRGRIINEITNFLGMLVRATALTPANAYHGRVYHTSEDPRLRFCMYVPSSASLAMTVMMLEPAGRLSDTDAL